MPLARCSCTLLLSNLLLLDPNDRPLSRFFTNSFSGPEPPRTTCYIQSALVLAFGPAVASAALSLVVTVSLTSLAILFSTDEQTLRRSGFTPGSLRANEPFKSLGGKPS